MKAQTATTRVLEIAVAGYAILLVLQLWAYFMTHIVVLLAVAFEGLASLLVAILLLYSAFRSEKLPDEVHMFGYGRAQNVASLAAATVFIAFMSVEVFRQAIPKFFQGHQSGVPLNTDLALVVIVASLVIPIFPIGFILKVKERSAALKAQLVSSLEDLMSYVAGLVGIILVGRGYYLADPIASIIVGIAIVFFGIYLFAENTHFLLGKAPSAQLIQRIESSALSVEGVLSVNNLRGEYIGHGVIQAGLEIEIARGTVIEEADRIAHEVQEKISRETGCQYCVIHTHPAKAPQPPP